MIPGKSKSVLWRLANRLFFCYCSLPLAHNALSLQATSNVALQNAEPRLLAAADLA
jgi:hypothetical protein